MSDPAHKPPHDTTLVVMQSKNRLWMLDLTLLALGILAIGFVLGLLTFSVLWQQESYQSGLSLVKEGKSFDVAAMLAFARAHDFAIVRTNGLFLGFLLVFMGCIYVLRVNETRFSLGVEAGQIGKGNLESSSPGLVLAVLGVALVICVVTMGKSQMNYSPPKSSNTEIGTSAPVITPIE